jgi:hypothetical protein
VEQRIIDVPFGMAVARNNKLENHLKKITEKVVSFEKRNRKDPSKRI